MLVRPQQMEGQGKSALCPFTGKLLTPKGAVLATKGSPTVGGSDPNNRKDQWMSMVWSWSDY
jgi:hypothetical protein